MANKLDRAIEKFNDQINSSNSEETVKYWQKYLTKNPTDKKELFGYFFDLLYDNIDNNDELSDDERNYLCRFVCELSEINEVC